ncbi:tetratricopeptide repeat protein [Pseudoalteromonas ruthenica]|uniref:tetratricopeptide repeat protein n=1 Tax=Pseudoalteromonas ruthenica TaxID=151081 RepID=UPI00110C0E53|nr:tetratricopeptide repeat protein [Pseudoalteromonas ruthenica]TMO43004.1 transcriptional regulator [Pseudoalteromonas ruthenica]TMO48799.1 transcriptional regulator [Pseudoalteromonas ruthenica]
MSDVWLDDQFDLEHSYSVSAITQCIQAEARWHAQANVDDAFAQLKQLQQAASEVYARYSDKHQALDAIVDCFYSDWSFSGTQQEMPEYRLNSVYFTLLYRTGNNLSLAIVLQAILEHCRFNADIALIDQSVMVQVSFSAQEYYLIEPASGQQIWHLQPENAETDNETLPEMVFDEEAYKLYLAHQKWAFIGAERFGDALACVELLIELLGDDPYERRDRGYLLNQIDRPELAKADLRFFVDECPDDPAIELVRHQIDELDNNNNTLH